MALANHFHSCDYGEFIFYPFYQNKFPRISIILIQKNASKPENPSSWTAVVQGTFKKIYFEKFISIEKNLIIKNKKVTKNTIWIGTNFHWILKIHLSILLAQLKLKLPQRSRRPSYCHPSGQPPPQPSHRHPLSKQNLSKSS